MIRKADECKKEFREKMRDGNGTVEITNFIEGPEELCNKGRMFSRVILKSGCSIGFHVHEKDSELFYILKGEAEYNDNGDLIYEGDYLNNKRNGQGKEYIENKIIFEGEYLKGKNGMEKDMI